MSSPGGTAGSRRTATRVKRGAISLSNSSHFPLMPYSNLRETCGIAARPRQTLDESGANWIGDCANTIGMVRLACSNGPAVCGANGQDDIRREAQPIPLRVCGCRRHCLRPSVRRSVRCGHRSSPIAAGHGEKPQCGPVASGSVRASTHEHTDAPHPLCLLRTHRKRPYAAAPPSSVMNSRRFIRSPRRRWRPGWGIVQDRAPWRS